MEDEDDRIIKLKSKDEQVFELTADAASISDLVRDSLTDAEDDDPIEILRVSSDCLEKVVEFLKHYKEENMKEIPTPLGGSSFNEIMDQKWYQDFVADENLNREMLFDLLTAANYMGIKPLLDLTCLKVTFQLTGKNAEEIRQILNLPELSPEEEAQAREEHKWIFEDS